jgi:hypothetical protein
MHPLCAVTLNTQDMATLTATLEQLASHPWASSYTVLLAMESKEAGAAAKAGQLQETYGCSFHSILFTLHVLDPSEMPGKASNVNASVRQFYHMATGDRSSYMLTVMDAGVCAVCVCVCVMHEGVVVCVCVFGRGARQADRHCVATRPQLRPQQTRRCTGTI